MKIALMKIGRSFCRRPFASAWLALALLFAVSATRAHAQGQEPEPAQQEQGARAQRPGLNLMQRLNLTPEQRAQLRDIRRQSEPEARELTRRLRQARRALDEAIYADAVDEAQVEQRLRALSEAQAALLRHRSATELRVRRVLTPEQLQAFRDLRQQAQRRQLMQRRLRGAAQQQPPAPAAQGTTDSNTQTDAQRDRRPANASRPRPRVRLGRPQ